MTTRLNARIDAELAAKLDRMQRRTNKSITEIVRESLELYYERFQRDEEGSSSRILQESEFIGCAEADPELSTTYKVHLHESLSRKAGA